METNLPSRDLSPKAIIIPPTDNPYVDSIYIDTFKELPLYLQREYAIYYNLPNATKISSAEICALLQLNEWIPALQHHVWIPTRDFMGVTVSDSIEHLDMWRDTQLILQHVWSDASGISINDMYGVLRARWEQARQDARARRDLPADEEGTEEKGDASAYASGSSNSGSSSSRARPTQIPQPIRREMAITRSTHTQAMSPAQLHLAKAREQITRSELYYKLRKEPIVVDGDTYGDIVRLEEKRMGLAGRPGPMAQQVQPSVSTPRAQAGPKAKQIQPGLSTPRVQAPKPVSALPSMAAPNTPPTHRLMRAASGRFEAAKSSSAQDEATASSAASTSKRLSVVKRPRKPLRKSTSKAKASPKAPAASTSNNNPSIPAANLIEKCDDSPLPMPSFATAIKTQEPQPACVESGESSKQRLAIENSSVQKAIEDKDQEMTSEPQVSTNDSRVQKATEKEDQGMSSEPSTATDSVCVQGATDKTDHGDEPNTTAASNDDPFAANTARVDAVSAAPNLFAPPLSPEMVYVACVLRGRELKRQYAMLNVLEGEEEPKSQDTYAFVEAFRLMVLDASQAVVAHAQTLVAGIQSFFGFGRSHLKRTREADDLDLPAQRTESPFRAQAELAPVTPQRKRVKREETEDDDMPSSPLSPTPCARRVNRKLLTLSDDTVMGDATQSSTSLPRTERRLQELTPKPRKVVDRLAGVLRSSGSKYRTQLRSPRGQEGPSTPTPTRRSARIANESPCPRRSPRK